LAASYAAEHLRASAAAEAGFVDEIVDPVDTRGRLAAALHTLSAL
jgi:acetyl-CoA carboxylase carboxyltransferase component